MKISQKPEISVLMSVFNGMPHLKEAVESILGQTYSNFELIIVNDASTDGTWNYLVSLKDKKVHLTKNNSNLGLASSLNKGLKLCRGNFIARMDADDISSPKRLETQYKFMKNHPEIDICGSWANLIDHKGKIIGDKRLPLQDKEIKKKLIWQSPIIHPTLMAKKSFFKNLKGYSPKFDMAEDYELLMRAKNNYVFANIPKKLLSWRLWENRRSRKVMDQLDKLDLKIKLDSVKNDGLNTLSLLAVAKKIFFIYLVPLPIKIKLSQILKRA